MKAKEILQKIAGNVTGMYISDMTRGEIKTAEILVDAGILQLKPNGDANDEDRPDDFDTFEMR